MSNVSQNMNSKARAGLCAEDWAEAALEAIGWHGVQGVAVEPIARDLGVTKGSFYWHFANRDALLLAALKLWESRETDDVLARASHEADPAARLKRLIDGVNTSKRASRTYSALSSTIKPVFVRETVERVSKRRFNFIADCYADLGLASNTARQWALMTFSIFLGSLQVRHDLSDEWPAADSAAFTDYIKLLMSALVPADQDDTARARLDVSNPNVWVGNTAS